LDGEGVLSVTVHPHQCQDQTYAPGENTTSHGLTTAGKESVSHIHVKRLRAVKFMDGENIRAILRLFSGNRSTPLNPVSCQSLLLCMDGLEMNTVSLSAAVKMEIIDLKTL